MHKLCSLFKNYICFPWFVQHFDNHRFRCSASGLQCHTFSLLELKNTLRKSCRFLLNLHTWKCRRYIFTQTHLSPSN